MTPTIGWSNFALRSHNIYSGNSYTNLSETDVIDLVKNSWDKRTPGNGEKDLSRKVLVPITFEAGTFFLPMVDLDERMKVYARIVKRQEGEKPYLETYVDADEICELGIKLKEPKFVNIVCYSAEALTENGGERTTNDEWEIVCILASMVEKEPMTGLDMSRNMLEKVGGTKSEYSAQEFAEAIWYWSGLVKVKKKLF